MAHALASKVVSALSNTAVMVSAHSATEQFVYVHRANDGTYLARIEMFYDDLFDRDVYEIRRANGGFKLTALDLNEVKSMFEKEVSGYPTEADKRRNYSRAVYKETSY